MGKIELIDVSPERNKRWGHNTRGLAQVRVAEGIWFLVGEASFT